MQQVGKIISLIGLIIHSNIWIATFFWIFMGIAMGYAIGSMFEGPEHKTKLSKITTALIFTILVIEAIVIIVLPVIL